MLGLPIQPIDYQGLFVLVLCMLFFAKAAQLESKSQLLWGGLSLGFWVGLGAVGGGWLGGPVSQILLFLVFTALGLSRDRKLAAKRP